MGEESIYTWEGVGITRRIGQEGQNKVERICKLKTKSNWRTIKEVSTCNI